MGLAIPSENCGILTTIPVSLLDEKVLDNPPEYCILKNNADRIEYAVKYIIKHKKKIPQINIQPKNAAESTKTKEMGNLMFSRSPCNTVAIIYTKAVAQAPQGSIELALAYANRSAALCEEGLYEDCLLDIKRALSAGYPDNLKAKLYARRAKCLFAINQIMSIEVHRAIADTMQWLPKVIDAEKIKVINILKTVMPNHSFKKPYVKWNDSEFIPEVPKENLKLSGVSKAIKIIHRGVVMIKDIEPGEPLMIQRAYVTTLPIYRDPMIAYEYCWRCCKRVWAGVPCYKCVNVIFCDDKCRVAAWDEYHDIECPIIGTLLDKTEFIGVHFMSLRVTIKAFKEAGSLGALKDKLGELDTMKDPNDVRVFDGTKYASVYALPKMSKKKPLPFIDALNSAWILYLLSTTTEILGEQITNFNEILNNKWSFFLGAFILNNIDIIRRNALEQTINGDNGQIRKRGVLVPVANLFYHSCDPSAIRYNLAGDTNVIVSLQRIKKGKQVYLSHGQSYWNMPTVMRQKQLKKRLSFCPCMACRNNWGPDNCFPSYRNIARTSFKRVEKINRLLPMYIKYASIVDYKKLKQSDIAEALVCLITLLKVYGENIKVYPCEELVILKRAFIELIQQISH